MRPDADSEKSQPPTTYRSAPAPTCALYRTLLRPAKLRPKALQLGGTLLLRLCQLLLQLRHLFRGICWQGDKGGQGEVRREEVEVIPASTPSLQITYAEYECLVPN